MFYRVGLYSIFLSYSYLGLMESKPISIEVRNVVFKFPYSILINYFVVTTITRRLAHQTMMNLELIWTRVLGWGFDTIKSRGNYFFVFLRLLKIFKLTIICKIVLRYLKLENVFLRLNQWAFAPFWSSVFFWHSLTRKLEKIQRYREFQIW